VPALISSSDHSLLKSWFMWSAITHLFSFSWELNDKYVEVWVQDIIHRVLSLIGAQLTWMKPVLISFISPPKIMDTDLVMEIVTLTWAKYWRWEVKPYLRIESVMFCWLVRAITRPAGWVMVKEYGGPAEWLSGVKWNAQGNTCPAPLC
jgi:hypothetical protein